MPSRRRSRLGPTLPRALLALALAWLAAGAVLRGSPADAASRPAAARNHEQVRVVDAKLPATYRIAFFGDSVTVGAGASSGGGGYVSRVSSWLRVRGKRVVATVNAKSGVPVAYWQHAPVPRRLDAAVVELGTNDVRLRTSSAQFARQYRRLTSRIRAANPRAQLLCLSVWSRPRGGALERMVNGRIRAACPGTYVDITRLGDLAHVRSTDGFHPNDAGYGLIAKAVVARLKPP